MQNHLHIVVFAEIYLLFTHLSFDMWQMMEVELKKLEDTINSIHEEMFYLRARYGLQ